MADEQQTAAPIEQAPPAIEQEQTTTPVDEPEMIPEPGEELDDDTGDDEPGELEVIEIDWDDGKKYQIPKALEGGLLKNKDYTQGKQAIAETRKALEAERAQIEERSKATDEELDARASLRAIDTTLAEYAKLTAADWAAHRNIDPISTENAWVEFQMLKEQRDGLSKTLDAKQTERSQVAQQDLAKRVDETLTFAKTKLPGFNDQTIPQLIEFAAKRGIPEAALKSNWSPLFAELLFDARIGSMTRQNAATAQKLPDTTIKPLDTVGGRSTPASRSDLASASMEDYVAARKRGVGGKPLR